MVPTQSRCRKLWPEQEHAGKLPQQVWRLPAFMIDAPLVPNKNPSCCVWRKAIVLQKDSGLRLHSISFANLANMQRRPISR